MVVEPHDGAKLLAAGMRADARSCTGPIVGVLMLDTRFPRFPGDIGHPESLPYPSLHRTIEAATVAEVVANRPLPDTLVERFIEEGRELVDAGAGLLVTSCGFLHAEQSRLADGVGVPLISSALVLLPLIQSLHGSRGPIGILTFDARALGERHLSGAGSIPIVIEGMQSSAYFHRVISEDLLEADASMMRADAVRAARALARHAPSAVVLECTNLSPWRNEIRDAFGGVAVFDLHDAIACCRGALGVNSQHR